MEKIHVEIHLPEKDLTLEIGYQSMILQSQFSCFMTYML